MGLVVLAVLAGGGALALAFALREAGALRQVLFGASTDVFSLSTGTSGPVTLSGTAVRLDESVQSPFTGTDCLALEYEVQELRSTGKSVSWVAIDSGRAAVPFLLEDESASVLVDPTRVRLGLDRSDVIEVDGGDRPPRGIREFIERSADVDSEERTLDLKVVELNVGNDRRYIEHRLEPGESVTVFGNARSESGTSTRSGQVNAVVSAGAHPLVLSETTPYRTILRVFWPVLVAALVGVTLLGAVALLTLL